MEELRREGIEELPKFKFLKTIVVGPKRYPGLATIKGEILIAADEVDKMLEMGYPETFIKLLTAEVFFHELRHFKDFKHMTPEGLEEFTWRYVEDPVYHKEFEMRAAEYASRWAVRIWKERWEREMPQSSEASELTAVSEDWREALKKYAEKYEAKEEVE